MDRVREMEKLLRADRQTRALGFKPGRGGPGGGTPATPANTAALLLAALSGASRAELPRTVLDLWHSVPTGSVTIAAGEEARLGEHLVVDSTPSLTIRRDGFTQQTMFGAALRTLLADRELATRVDSIVVYQDLAEGHLCYRHGREVRRAQFHDAIGGEQRAASLARHGVARVAATLPGASLAAIAAALVAARTAQPGAPERASA